MLFVFVNSSALEKWSTHPLSEAEGKRGNRVCSGEGPADDGGQDRVPPETVERVGIVKCLPTSTRAVIDHPY